MNYAQYIDHTLLKQDATKEGIDKIISEAKQYGFKTVCVNSSWVSYCKEQLKDTNVGITAVIGFPLGAMATSVKVFETQEVLNSGADEVDMVINIGQLKDKNYDYVLDEIKAIKKACGSNVLKVIIETALLTIDEARKATELTLISGADFVKTSTGFSTRGATFDDVIMMKEIVGDKIGIKAAGGVKTFADMEKMISLGATRIGTSSGVKLLEGQNTGEGY